MIQLSDFLSRLQGVERHGDQYMARCPAHDDRKASLAVKMGDKKIVCQCMAGCAYEDIIAAMGLDWKDVVKPEYLHEMAGQPAPRRRRSAPKPEAKAKPEEKKPGIPVDLSRMKVGGTYTHKQGGQAVQSRITAQYDYTDAQGNPVVRVFRTEDKQFPTIHMEGDTWCWGDGGRQDLLYRLPEVCAAIQRGDRIYLVEGEKDVHTMAAANLTATCNKGGARKFPEALAQELKGARVAIIPDNDEPGRKHALLAARSLEGIAKEVRILDLRKIEGVELPEKGDVSDLVKTHDFLWLEQELKSLAERSPVLSRVVSDADYEEYFQLIHGAKVENGSIYGMKNNEYFRLCNFVALPVEQVLLDDGLTDPRYQLTIMGWSAKGYRMKTIRVPLEEFDRMDWPSARWGLDAIVQEGSTTKGKIRRIIQEAGSRAAVSRVMYAHTGWRRIDGKWCFLHGGGAIGSESASVRLDFGFQRYDLSGLRSGPLMEKSPEDRLKICQNHVIRLMGVAGLRIGAPLTGFVFLAPLRHWLEMIGRRPSFIPFLYGETGSGKSTIASLFMQCFGYDFGFEKAQPASFDDTAAAISLKLFALKDLPLLVDDFHPESDAKRAASMANVAEQISRMAGDGMHRSRMRSDATAQEDKPSRGLCIETGEEVPRISPSGVARLYTIQIKYGDVPIPASFQAGRLKTDEARVQEMKALTKDSRDGTLNEAMRKYIEWLAAQADTLPATLESKLDALTDEALRRMTGVHPRLPTAAAFLMLGAEMMIDYMQAPGGLLENVEKGPLMAKLWDAVVLNGLEQTKDMQEDKPAELFMSTVRDLVTSGKGIVQELATATDAAPQGLIGYSDADFYYLIPSETYRAVQKSLMEQGGRMPIGKNQLFKTLAQEKMIVKSPNGKNVRQLKRGSIHAWMLWVPRVVLDGLEEVDGAAVGDPFLKERQEAMPI